MASHHVRNPRFTTDSSPALLVPPPRRVPVQVSPSSVSSPFIVWDFIMRHKALVTLVALLCVAALATLSAFGGASATQAFRTGSVTQAFQAASFPQAAGPEPVLTFGAPIAVQETNDVLIVKPKVSYDPRGGFLVADVRERQLRRYDAQGHLLKVIARKGDGPGEFRHPVAALRLGNGNIVGVDMRGRLATFDAAGERLLSTQTVPLAPIYSAAVLDDSTLVFAGTRETGDVASLVHVWDLKHHRILRSFGKIPAHPPEMEGAYSFVGSAAIAVRNGQIALMFALSDSLRIFDRAGRSVEPSPVAIPWRHFRPLTRPMPTSDVPEDTDRWLSMFSAAASLYWRADGSFVVQYLDVNKSDERWSIVGISRGGERLFEFVDQPRLLAVGPSGNQLLFVNPGSELQNSWVPGFIH
jgi:hypothetical protein